VSSSKKRRVLIHDLSSNAAMRAPALSPPLSVHQPAPHHLPGRLRVVVHVAVPLAVFLPLPRWWTRVVPCELPAVSLKYKPNLPGCADGDRVDNALAFRHVYGEDKEAHYDALAQHRCSVHAHARHAAPDLATRGLVCPAAGS
jgi:hypothetical protein